MSQRRFNASIILCCDSSSNPGEDSSPVVLSLFASWVSCFSMTRYQILLEHWWWAGLAAREWGVGRLSTENDVSAQSTQVNLNQLLNEDRSKEQPLLAIKRRIKKALPLLSTLFPFALTTTPHLHWRERLGSWLLNVKYSCRTPSITVLGKH